jgi:hypothetical protein
MPVFKASHSQPQYFRNISIQSLSFSATILQQYLCSRPLILSHNTSAIPLFNASHSQPHYFSNTFIQGLVLSLNTPAIPLFKASHSQKQYSLILLFKSSPSRQKNSTYFFVQSLPSSATILYQINAFIPSLLATM